MPNETVYLTEIEVELLQVFIKHHLLRDATIVNILKALVEKLEK